MHKNNEDYTNTFIKLTFGNTLNDSAEYKNGIISGRHASKGKIKQKINYLN